MNAAADLKTRIDADMKAAMRAREKANTASCWLSRPTTPPSFWPANAPNTFQNYNLYNYIFFSIYYK